MDTPEAIDTLEALGNRLRSGLRLRERSTRAAMPAALSGLPARLEDRDNNTLEALRDRLPSRRSFRERVNLAAISAALSGLSARLAAADRACERDRGMSARSSCLQSHERTYRHEHIPVFCVVAGTCLHGNAPVCGPALRWPNPHCLPKASRKALFCLPFPYSPHVRARLSVHGSAVHPDLLRWRLGVRQASRDRALPLE